MTPAVSFNPLATQTRLERSDASDLEARISVDLARQLRGQDISLTALNLVNVLITTGVFRHTAQWEWLVFWLALQGFNAVFHLLLGVRSLRRPINTQIALELLRISTRTSLFNGLLWMLGVQIFWPGGSDAERMLLVCWMLGITAIALHALHVHLPAYFALTLPCLAGIALAMLSFGGFGGWGIVAILVLYVLAVARFAWALHRLLVDSLRQRHQVAELADQLRLEKDRAVNLSQARSRFLAAASHDLRQPVHALSLFVGALKQNPSPKQAQLILQHVGAAVDAMGTMFNALLDISKLDAELLQPNWQNVDLYTLLTRIAADHTAVARDKGINFQCDVSAVVQQSVYTDPVLLERILHNLLSNAVRYTAQGTVGIKARVRQGRAEVRVFDTGAGIAREHQSQAFEEFVQLHSATREHEQGLGVGLGLGLSIVKRLTELMRMELVLRSRPGRGTIFTLHLPVATPLKVVLPAAASTQELTSDVLRDTGVVIVIDDSVEIQLAMRALLSGWGYQVFAAASVSALMPQLMALTQTPRLLLCDYRLRDGANGIDAIAQLQEIFNVDVPAILITGDTGPERLREAVASGLPLLHKPVSQSQLREAITTVLEHNSAVAAD